MYELMILGRLAVSPMHGYLIASIIGDIIGPFRRVQYGSLYPVLNRLEQEHLIRSEESSGAAERTKKVYAITDLGRERLREHLMDTTRHLAEYDQVFAHKVALFPLLEQEERLFLCRHYTVYAQQHVDHLERERRDLVRHSRPTLPTAHLEQILVVMNHRIDFWSRERAWAEELIAENAPVKEAI